MVTWHRGDSFMLHHLGQRRATLVTDDNFQSDIHFEHGTPFCFMKNTASTLLDGYSESLARC